MTRRLIGLVAALLAGAWLGFEVEWLSESGGWNGTQEMPLAAAAGWGALEVGLAFCLVEACLWHRPDRWVLRLVTTALVGAMVFIGAVYVPNHLAYLAAFPEQRDRWFDARDYSLRLPFVAGELLMIMGTIVGVAAGPSRLALWLASPDLPGSPARSIADR